MWVSKVVNVFRSVDKYGNNFELNHKGRTTFKTVFGAVVTLAVAGVLIWYISRLIQQVIDTTNPTVTFLRQITNQGSTQFSLVDEELLPIVFFVNKTSNLPIPAAIQQFYFT